MLSIQHIMASLYCHSGNLDYIKENAAAIIFPDAIRAYSKIRAYSHFEKSIEEDSGYGEFSINKGGGLIAYWEMPSDMKNINQESINESLKSAKMPYRTAKCVIGEMSDINRFYETNSHLPSKMFRGIEEHLKEDILFDIFFRKQLDTSQRFKDIFYIYRGNKIKKLDGIGARKFATEIEQQGIYILAYLIHKDYGLTINQQWFDNVIKPVLFRDYSEELAEKTFSFMKIDEEVNNLITNHDWSKIQEGFIPFDDYIVFYKCLNNIINYDLYNDFKSDKYVLFNNFVKPILELDTGVQFTV